ncbi:MAG: thioredoxin family protein [Oscillospiraceae bacterium]|nr:thioredoxin family protein [Oscillospiraceae bacterium]
MGLFGKKKEAESCCCCAGNCTQQQMEKAEGDKAAPGVKVLGSGCAKCIALEAAAKEALSELGMDTAIEHVTDFAEIAAYGVMTTPALVVDGKVVSYGKVLKKDEVAALLKKARG